MDQQWEAALDRLERATQQLSKTDPDQPAEMEQALLERFYAVSAIAELTNRATAPVPDQVGLDRLAQALGSGSEALQKWMLARENARAELARTTQLEFTLRGLLEPESVPPRQVDYSG